MGISEIMSRLGEKNRERKEAFRQMQTQDRLQTMLEERKMSSNERELRRFVDEERENEIKEQLEQMRKSREVDIRFNHNPLNVKNITSHTEWNVLREKNQFAGKGCMFTNNESVLKNNPKLLRNNTKLLKGGKL